MNCDQVFQQLTSVRPVVQNGEFTRHLDDCSSCRQMAQLFEPAVRLLVGESDDVPTVPNECGDRWARIWQSASIADRAAAQLEPTPTVGKWRIGGSISILRTAAVLLTGVIFGFVCARANVFPGTERANTTVQIPDGGGGRHRECRYEDLLARQFEAGPVQFCANCRPKLAAELSAAVAICSVCHSRAPDDESPLRIGFRPLF